MEAKGEAMDGVSCKNGRSPGMVSCTEGWKVCSVQKFVRVHFESEIVPHETNLVLLARAIAAEEVTVTDRWCF